MSRVVIFDFNGTLSDDEPLLREIFTQLFTSHLGWSMSADEYAADFAGLSDREIIERAVLATRGEAAEGDALVERLLGLRGERYRERAAAQCPVREPARYLVDALVDTGRTLAIVTGAQRADVELVLPAGGLTDAFTTVVTAEDVAVASPTPKASFLPRRASVWNPATCWYSKTRSPGSGPRQRPGCGASECSARCVLARSRRRGCRS